MQNRVLCSHCRWDMTMTVVQGVTQFTCPRCGCGLFNTVQRVRGMQPPNYQGGRESVNRGGKPLIANTK